MVNGDQVTIYGLLSNIMSSIRRYGMVIGDGFTFTSPNCPMTHHLKARGPMPLG